MHSTSSRGVVICFPLLVLCYLTSSCSGSACTTDTKQQPVVSGYGYELMLAKLDFLQYKLQEVECALRERDHAGPFESCQDVPPAKESGVFLIRPSVGDEPFEAFCEQKSFGGGWMVLLHRFDGSVDFYRNWTEYRNGFGSVYQEFWMGLEQLHQLTSRRSYELMVEIKDYEGNYRFARYREFGIGSEADQYSLQKLGAYDGTAGDSLTYHKGMKFTTIDQDNDDNGEANCAKSYLGAWWYKKCHYAHLNGRYIKGDDPKSMSWYHYKSVHQGLAFSRMMIRETKASA